MINILHDYEQGNISALQALRALCSEYGENASELEPLETQQKELRKAIEHIVQREGTQEIRGFGKLSMVQPTTLAKWNGQALDALVLELMQSSEPINPFEVAAKIAACKSESTKSGFLRIEREK
jgi:hypothetical protein